MRASFITFFAVTCLVGFSTQQRTFTNPILDGNSADPSVMKVGNYYYLTLSEERETELTIFKSPTLTNFRNAEKTVAYRTKDGQSNLWASEMHEVNGDLYIYFCMDGNGKDHRMYAIKADDPTNPMGTWSDAIRLMPDWDHGAIDGTVMKHGNGKNYFVWASPAFNRPLSLWIAELIDPVTVGESKLYLREPRSEWETRGGPVNEGAYFIYRNNVSYMIFSASTTWTPDYCLGLMSIEGDKDPMNPSFWNYGEDEPVFFRNDEEDVYTTGHASFTVSNDGTETWMIYHGTVNTTHINGFRIARIEKIDWDENDRPVFPRPHGYNHPQPVPSGDPENEQKRTFNNPILDGNSADPAVLKVGKYYYLTLSEERETELTVFKSPTLTNFRNAEKSVAYRTKEGERNLWASEMHEVDGGLYIYFTMEVNGQDLKDHRMFVIKADDPTNPMGTWSDPIRLMPDWEYGSIDGTVMKHGNGKNYFVWASIALNRPLSLWIAELIDPVTVGESKLFLRGPHSEWETHGGPTNEGPYFMYRNNVSFLIFSASSTWDANYCLGLMSIDGDKDPMNPSEWYYGEDEPVFYRNDEEDVYTTGHATFTVSNDETETWMVYHGTVNTTHIDGFRIARIEKIDWDENDRPVFPRPHGYNHPQPVPSGDPDNVNN
ncbi:unnamed protein product [Allacma fusca]|uniref:Alpha-N-arabinofuranosidase n=1 Tax=Allacma fusca TaxID=39272 RepID=A0A8J2LIN1_9HEXA|nr:unnamed protein product [Allacma fusca]